MESNKHQPQRQKMFNRRNTGEITTCTSLQSSEVTEIYKCQYCGETYINFIYMKIHHVLHHKDDNTELAYNVIALQNVLGNQDREVVIIEPVERSVREEQNNGLHHVITDFDNKVSVTDEKHENADEESQTNMERCDTKSNTSGTLDDIAEAENRAVETKIGNSLSENEEKKKSRQTSIGKQNSGNKMLDNIQTCQMTYDCSVCGKIFFKKTYLRIHQRIHTGIKPYECTLCREKFSHKHHLTRHKRTHTGEKPHQCMTCGKKFSQKHTLTIHSITHTDEKPYECNLCAQHFARRDDLTRHRRTHTGEKPYECAVCGKKFSQPHVLTIHKRTHTGEKPYGCTICGKMFSRKQDLIKHTRTHTGEKPFECTVCGKKFATSSNFTIHKRTHTGEKPHECTACGRRFSEKSHLKKHERTHTGKK